MPRVADPVLRYPEKDGYWRQGIYWMLLWELTGTLRGGESKPSMKVNVLKGQKGRRLEGGLAALLEKCFICEGCSCISYSSPKNKKWLKLACAGETLAQCKRCHHIL